MSSPGAVDLRCRIDSMVDPIEGLLSDAKGRSMPFRGWIELAAALTSLAEGAKREESNVPKEQSDE
jgi:uncharacterized lipoprotein YddW (UPF0748 family)